MGLLGKDVAPQVQSTERPKNVRISLYSNPAGRAPLIAAVPFTKLMVDRMPRRIESNKPDSPGMLEIDLLGRANRKALGE